MNATTPARALCLQRLRAVRERSRSLTRALSAEDQVVQSMPDASPVKWHLAHTSWFFEAVVLQPHAPGFQPADPRYALLFNSYYESLGPRHPRPQRGLLTRPSHDEVLAYRAAVEAAVVQFIESADDDTWAAAGPLIELGLQHEQQHQELILTDVLHLFSSSPLRPAVDPAFELPRPVAGEATWLAHAGGEVEIGHDGTGFCFDNETPRHVRRLEPFAIASRLVTNRDWLRFIDDGGYRRAGHWLSDGWATVQAQGWEAPAYWRRASAAAGGGWQHLTLRGEAALDLDAAVQHLSFYEATAYADWAGARLPTEVEWEAAAQRFGASMQQLDDTAWQWTRSSYDPYPRFRPLSGAVGEYNGKFMVGQLVLRGGSLATPPGHARTSYRNFFPPAARWQFSGLRLAKDLT